MPSFVQNFGRDIAEAACQRVQLLLGRMQMLGTVSVSPYMSVPSKKGKKDVHSEIGNNDVTIRILGSVEDIFGSAIAYDIYDMQQRAQALTLGHGGQYRDREGTLLLIIQT